MPADEQRPVRTFVLVPERNLGHAIARKLGEDPAIRVIGVSTNPDEDAYRIYDADPDVIVADFQAGGLKFLYSERLPPGKHRVVFFAPRSEAGCDACYQALVHGAQGIMCRPGSPEEVADRDELLASVREGTPLRPADCPAVRRLRDEQAASSED
jgi:DNA-binding NarL/FixJ family response regulator